MYAEDPNNYLMWHPLSYVELNFVIMEDTMQLYIGSRPFDRMDHIRTTLPYLKSLDA